MINRHAIIVVGVAAVISAGIWFTALSRRHSQQQESVTSKVFKGPGGWGYDILVNEKVFIHQENIPVIAAKKGFDEEQEAEKAAGLVIQKMHENKLPTLTKTDIDHICSPRN